MRLVHRHTEEWPRKDTMHRQAKEIGFRRTVCGIFYGGPSGLTQTGMWPKSGWVPMEFNSGNEYSSLLNLDVFHC